MDVNATFYKLSPEYFTQLKYIRYLDRDWYILVEQDYLMLYAVKIWNYFWVLKRTRIPNNTNVYLYAANIKKVKNKRIEIFESTKPKY